MRRALVGTIGSLAGLFLLVHAPAAGAEDKGLAGTDKREAYCNKKYGSSGTGS